MNNHIPLNFLNKSLLVKVDLVSTNPKFRPSTLHWSHMMVQDISNHSDPSLSRLLHVTQNTFWLICPSQLLSGAAINRPSDSDATRKSYLIKDPLSYLSNFISCFLGHYCAYNGNRI